MLGENIKAAREAAHDGTGIKQAELARTLGISPLRMWRYETNRARPSIEMLKSIAAAVGASVDALLSSAESGEHSAVEPAAESEKAS